ncbi:MAG: MBL fold metallo-hydrolase [Bacteroidetes bacterium]|nr:MBL fold metallo-hydrolase [Bacteroidota bacterium]
MLSRRELLKTMSVAGLCAATGAFPSGACNAASPPSYTPDLTEVRGNGLWSCWIGHSTVLINFFGTWILTDPVLFDAYGLSILGLTIGPRRLHQPALTLDQIPTPDLIILSHAHLDHMDRRTLSALAERDPDKIDVITAMNTSDVIEDIPFRSTEELDWCDTTTIHGIELQALRVKHNGWRMPGEACRAAGQHRTGRSYNGYLLEKNGVRLVFGGDTAFTPAFKDIRKPIDVAFMPIGAYDPFPDTHCTPEESLAMAEMMSARYMFPIHHATFKQSEEPMSEPMHRLLKALRTSTSSLALHTVGQSFHLPLT